MLVIDVICQQTVLPDKHTIFPVDLLILAFATGHRFMLLFFR